MRKQSTRITVLAIITILSFGIVANAQIRAYRVSDRTVQNLLDRVEANTNTFKSELDRALDRSYVDGTLREDQVNQMVSDFENATDRLESNFSNRRSTSADVEEVLTRGANIDAFMRANRLSANVESRWRTIRTDLNTLAGYYNVRANWNAGTWTGSPYTPSPMPYYVTDNQLRDLLGRLERNTNTFQNVVDRALDRSFRDNTVSEDTINMMIANFETATDQLRNNFNARRSTTDDVQNTLNRALYVNRFMANNRVNTRAQTLWNQIRSDLNTLAGYYRTSWNWNNPLPGYPPYGVGNFDAQLTGTYRLNHSMSDSIPAAVDRAIINANYNVNQRDRVRRNLERRLMSPEMLSIEKRGTQVTMSSPNGASVTFSADGVSRSETSPNGRTVRTSVTANGRDLTINYEGDRMNDYFVTFTPIAGDRLRVTRRVFLENKNETVTVTSVYDRSSSVPDWNTGYTGTLPSGGFVIPNNTQIIATLDTMLSTKTAKNGDRFRMTVTSPSQYRGAVIEGTVVGERSGVFLGRADMTLSFDTIRLTNGQTYRFAGIVEQVREPDGDTVSVNNEGNIRAGSQTTRTATRAGIGGLLGAIIGAIAGGGEGAAIGAAVGAGAGAGTVVIQGRDNLELETGSTFNITATSPSSTVGIR